MWNQIPRSRGRKYLFWTGGGNACIRRKKGGHKKEEVAYKIKLSLSDRGKENKGDKTFAGDKSILMRGGPKIGETDRGNK